MKKFMPYLLLAAFAVTACGASRSTEQLVSEPYANDGVAPLAGGAPAQAPLPSDAAAAESANAAGSTAAESQRIVIKNAQLSIVVDDVNARMTMLGALAKKYGGYVVSSSVYQSYTNNGVLVPQGQIVVRVDATQLDAALAEIKKDTVDVQNESVSGIDVTADYTDQQSRLKNLEAAEAQLQEIMKQATKTEDVITVFNQLTSIREQIEVVKGQIKYYEESAALSEVTVQVIAKETIQPIKIGGWEPKGVAQAAIQDLVYFFQDFADFLIRFVIYTLPVLITIGIPLYLIFLGLRAIFRRMRANRKDAPAEPAASADKKKK